MIQPLTHCVVADNSGAKAVMCIRVVRGVPSTGAQLGEQVYLTVKEALPRGAVKRKEVLRGVVVRQTKPFRRPDGSAISFDDNAVVLISPDGTPKGTRVFGPIAREIREKGYLKIVSMAPEVW